MAAMAHQTADLARLPSGLGHGIDSSGQTEEKRPSGSYCIRNQGGPSVYGFLSLEPLVNYQRHRGLPGPSHKECQGSAKKVLPTASRKPTDCVRIDPFPAELGSSESISWSEMKSESILLRRSESDLGVSKSQQSQILEFPHLARIQSS